MEVYIRLIDQVSGLEPILNSLKLLMNKKLLYFIHGVKRCRQSKIPALYAGQTPTILTTSADISSWAATLPAGTKVRTQRSGSRGNLINGQRKGGFLHSLTGVIIMYSVMSYEDDLVPFFL
jgi:hypothetical protein